jgi:hypothetical protein
MLYNKSSALPPKGSLREALFLTVELKRQEAEVLKTRVFAQGIVDLSEKGAEATAAVFQKYVAAALPFMKQQQSQTDQKMKEAMAKEVKKGIIVFNPPQANPLMQRAKAIKIDSETRDKLAHRGKRIVEL